MTKDQEDILNMYEAVDDVLQTHNAVWNTNVPFSDTVADFEANIDTIGNLRDQQEEDTTGVTQDKNNKRLLLESKTYTMGSIIVFYASVTNNRKLLEKVNYTRSKLENARDNELPAFSKHVHQAAVDNAAALVAYGVTPLMIADLGTAIDNFVKDIGKPREAVSDTSAATEQLPGVYSNNDLLLAERLDKGMELFKAANPDFYTQYFNARIIVNSPTLTRALDVKFVDDITGNPIAHVKVNVDGTINRRSSLKGNIRVQSLSEGAHSLTGKLPGYVDALQNFNVISGETTKIVVRMVKV
ncbi:MAG TPA: hypothetical protein VI757_06610 [Bacteroidia bacterium]|nr:hypothetical protein [Bacteroidia bacterium]